MNNAGNKWKKNTALFLCGEAVTVFGSMVVQYAIIWHIILNTQSGAIVTVFTVAGFLPMFLISPFGGVWADRYNRKYIINAADGAVALASLVAALLFLAGVDNAGVLLFAAIVRSFGQGVQMPAVGSFIPQIVPEEHLTRVNGIQSSVQSCSALAAPAISGVLMSFTSMATLFFLDVVTAAIGISILAFGVKGPKRKISLSAPAGEKPAYFRELKEGISYIRRQKFVLQLLALAAAFMFFASPAMLLTPLQVTRDFGSEVWRLTAIEITFSVGMMLGGVLIGAWGGFRRHALTIALSYALFGLETIGLGLVPAFWAYNGIMLIMGLTIPLYSAPVMTLLQTAVDPAFMGRVLSVMTMSTSVMVPAGMLVFGPVADLIPIDFLLIGTGLVMALLSIPFWMGKTLRAAGGS
ncbi:MAG: MFS transporter [Gracilibacteraceae bacterium]|nr:MFS transporter [Gracilibacteraceae bacterium]